jgi:hypothetical protein
MWVTGRKAAQRTPAALLAFRHQAKMSAPSPREFHTPEPCLISQPFTIAISNWQLSSMGFFSRRNLFDHPQAIAPG